MAKNDDEETTLARLRNGGDVESDEAGAEEKLARMMRWQDQVDEAEAQGRPWSTSDLR